MIPPAVRAAVKTRAKGHCEECGSRQPLELHHRTYRRSIHDPADEDDTIFGYETPEDLDALCRDCHHRRHVDLNGDFWADPEERADHWWYFNEQMERE